MNTNNDKVIPEEEAQDKANGQGGQASDDSYHDNLDKDDGKDDDGHPNHDIVSDDQGQGKNNNAVFDETYDDSAENNDTLNASADS